MLFDREVWQFNLEIVNQDEREKLCLWRWYIFSSMRTSITTPTNVRILWLTYWSLKRNICIQKPLVHVCRPLSYINILCRHFYSPFLWGGARVSGMNTNVAMYAKRDVPKEGYPDHRLTRCKLLCPDIVTSCDSYLVPTRVSLWLTKILFSRILTLEKYIFINIRCCNLWSRLKQKLWSKKR